MASIHTMQSWAQPDIHPGSHTSAEPWANKFASLPGIGRILSQALSLATVHTMQSWAQLDIHPGSYTSAEPRANKFASLPGIGHYFKPSYLIGYHTHHAVLGSARYPPRASHFCWASNQYVCILVWDWSLLSSLIGYSTYHAVLGSARYPPKVSHFCWASSQYVCLLARDWSLN